MSIVSPLVILTRTPSHEYDSPQGSTGSYFDIKPSMTEGSQIINPNKRKLSTEAAIAIGNATKKHISSPKAWGPSSPLRKTYEPEEILELSPKHTSAAISRDSKGPGKISLPKPTGLSMSIEVETAPDPDEDNLDDLDGL